MVKIINICTRRDSCIYRHSHVAAARLCEHKVFASRAKQVRDARLSYNNRSFKRCENMHSYRGY